MSGSKESHEILAEPSPEGVRMALGLEFCAVVISLVEQLDDLLMDATPGVGASVTVTMPGGVKVRFAADLERVP